MNSYLYLHRLRSLISTLAIELNEESLIAKPKLSDDSGRLEWLVEDPLPDRRYWINYRFEKKDDYDEAQFNG